MKNLYSHLIKAVLVTFQSLFFLISNNSDAKESDKMGKVEVLSNSPRVVVYHHFLSDKECDHLIKLAKPHLKRSTVIDNHSSGSVVDEARTSYGMFFWPTLEDRTVHEVEKRIASITSIPRENGEDIQVLKYGIGGEYKPHYDYFDPNYEGGKYHLQRGGQRVASFLMYLNTPEEGGETVFPVLGIKVTARKGDALLFYNCDASGNVDSRTLHGGAPVIKGEKWLATKWLRKHRFQ